VGRAEQVTPPLLVKGVRGVQRPAGHLPHHGEQAAIQGYGERAARRPYRRPGRAVRCQAVRNTERICSPVATRQVTAETGVCRYQSVIRPTQVPGARGYALACEAGGLAVLIACRTRGCTERYNSAMI
jgi:hypothetical protein